MKPIGFIDEQDIEMIKWLMINTSYSPEIVEVFTTTIKSYVYLQEVGNFSSMLYINCYDYFLGVINSYNGFVNFVDFKEEWILQEVISEHLKEIKYNDRI